MKKATTPPENFIDPVCLMEVNPGKQDLRFTYRMRTYYFCAEGCRKAFESCPDKYLQPKPPKRKGLWGRYLDRLSKTTGDKPIKCH